MSSQGGLDGADGGGGDPIATSLDEEYILQWNDHKYNFFSLAADDVFRSEEMTDITVCCGDQMFDAHKLILSVCSPLFRSMISRCVSRLNNQHPIIFLKDVRPCDFERLMHFMYYGQVRIPNGDLESLIVTAKSLRIKGLSAPSTQFDHQHHHHQQPAQQQDLLPPPAIILPAPPQERLNNQEKAVAEPTSVQEEPQNYSVNNNSIHRSPSPPGPGAPPPNPVTAIRNESSSSAAKVNANRNLPTPPKKRRLSALNSTGPEVNRPEDDSSNGKLVDEPEVNPTSPNKDESHVKKRASPGDAVSPRGSSAVIDGGAPNLVSERSASSSRSSPTSLQLTALAAAAATGGASTTTTSSDTSSPSPRGSLIIGDRSLANRHRLNASATTSLSSAANSARQNDRQTLLRDIPKPKTDVVATGTAAELAVPSGRILKEEAVSPPPPSQNEMVTLVNEMIVTAAANAAAAAAVGQLQRQHHHHHPPPPQPPSQTQQSSATTSTSSIQSSRQLAAAAAAAASLTAAAAAAAAARSTSPTPTTRGGGPTTAPSGQQLPLTESTRILPPTEPRQNGTCYFCKKAFMKNKQLMNHVCPKKPKPSK